jgi:hypothetical protein
MYTNNGFRFSVFCPKMAQKIAVEREKYEQEHAKVVATQQQMR